MLRLMYGGATFEIKKCSLIFPTVIHPPLTRYGPLTATIKLPANPLRTSCWPFQTLYKRETGAFR